MNSGWSRRCDVEALKRAITLLPRSVYRIKGFVRASDEPDHRNLLQAVGMRGDVQAYDGWGDRNPATGLVGKMWVADPSALPSGPRNVAMYRSLADW